MDERKKFTEAEILLGGLFTLGVDGVCMLIDFTGIGLIVAPIIQGFTTFLIWMWFKSKGDPAAAKLGRQAAKYAANFLPVLPTTFLAFSIEVFIHNHPKAVAAVTTLAGAALSAATGGAGAGVAAAALKAAGGTKAAAALSAIGGAAEGGALGEAAGSAGKKILSNTAAARNAFAQKPAPEERTRSEEDNPLL